jgi:hypothetical protein
MTPERRKKRREIEVELDLPRLILLGVILAVTISLAFLAGRATVPDAPSAARAESAGGGPTDSASSYEDVGGGKSLFDRTDDTVERELGRQVTPETSLGGGFEVDLGRTRGRAGAERLRRQAGELGVPTAIARDVGGRYRVAAGPFSTREDAREAAQRLARELGRDTTVRER